jgi:pimeloyl-ACP methyl ester carboxylesterase
MAEKLPSVLTHLAGEHCSIIGISTGASAAIALAAAAPERIDKLILLSPLLSDTAELPDFTRVKAATLVLVGTGDTPAVIEMGRLCREKISSCHLSFIYGVRHALMADRPQACLDPMLQFLEEGEQFIIFRESQAIRR